jgi:hypothetical protein
VENLRRELHPDLPHLGAHLTLLPPRPLQGTESAALQVLARICGQVEPFEVTLGDMESFVPTTPTVYIRVADSAERLCELHKQLNTQSSGVRRRVALHPSPYDREDGDRTGGETSPGDCPRSLAAVFGKPPHPARPAHICAGRRAKLLGRSGSGAARRQPRFALNYPGFTPELARLPGITLLPPNPHGPWYISLPCIAQRLRGLYTEREGTVRNPRREPLQAWVSGKPGGRGCRSAFTVRVFWER